MAVQEESKPEAVAAQAGPGRINHIKLLRFTCFVIVTLVSLCTRAAEHWQVLMALPAEETLLRVSNNNTDFQLGVRDASSITLVHSTLAPRYTQQLFYVPSVSMGTERHLVVRPVEKIAVEPQISVEIIEFQSGEDFRKTARLLSEIALGWSSASREERTLMLSRWAAHLKEPRWFQAQFPGLPSLHLTYLRMLFQHKELTRLVEYASTLLQANAKLAVAEQSAIKLYLAMALAEKGDFSQALELFNWLELNSPVDVSEMGDNKAVFAGMQGLCLVFMGMVQNNQSHLVTGQQKLAASIARAKQTGDYKLVANGLNNLNIPLYMQGDFAKIESNYRQSLQAHQNSGVDRDMRHTLSNFAMLKRNQGNYLEALKYNRLAVEVLPPNASVALSSIYYHNLGINYFVLGDYNRAERYFKLLSEQQSHVERADFLVVSSLYLARIYRARGDFDMALSALEPLLVPDAQNAQYQWLVFMEKGKTLLQQGDLDGANDALQNLEQVYAGSARAKDYLDLLLFRAELYWQSHEQTAFFSVMQELAVKFDESDDYPLRQLDYIQLKTTQLSQRAAESEIDESFRKGLEIIQRIFQSVRGTAHGIGWRNRIDDFLGKYLDFIYQQTELEIDRRYHKFFKVWNQVNGMNLFWQRQNVYAHEQQYNEIAELQRELWQLERAIVESEYKVKGHSDSLWLKKNQLQERIRGITEVQVVENRQQFVSDGADAVKLQSMLTADQILLGVQTGKEQSYLIAVTSQNMDILPIVDQSALSLAMAQLRSNVFKGQHIVQHQVRKLRQHLYLPAVLAGREEVFWVANNDLQLLPLALLLSEPNKPWQGKVTGIISVSEFWREIKHRKSSEALEKPGVVIFAASEFELGRQDWEKQKQEEHLRSWRTNLPDLPWTKMEAQQIAMLFGEQNVVTYSGKQATSQMFNSDLIHQAAILHVATHAYYNSENPEISGLAVFPDSQNNSGFLSMSEMTSRPFYNRLVVLSGCETMLGKVSDGEGSLGLSRALLSSGANATISTLWPVPDKATAKFMGYFYEQLQQTDGDIAASLTGAQARMQKHRRYQHPRYWASFLLTVVNKHFQKILVAQPAQSKNLH